MNHTTLKNWNILIIDENPYDIAALEELFAASPYHLCLARSCEEAKQVIEVFGFPHLIVTEKTFSNGMDGFEFSRLIRANSDIPIIVYSERIPTKLIVKAIDEFADDYIIKPVRPEMLLSHIRRVLRRIDFLPGALQSFSSHFVANYSA